MAANFWSSSHCNQWLFYDANQQQHDVVQHERHDETFLVRVLVEGNALFRVAYEFNYRYDVVAVARLLMRRFCIISPCKCQVDVRALSLACLTLAAKATEMPTLTMSQILEVIARFDPVHYGDLDAQALLTMEINVITALHFELVVFLPYEHVNKYVMKDNREGAVKEVVHAILNDCFLTLAPLQLPPHVLALSACLLAYSHLGVPETQWPSGVALARGIHMEEIKFFAEQLGDLYDMNVGETPLVHQAPVQKKLEAQPDHMQERVLSH